MISENLFIAEDSLEILFLSPKNLITLKSPPMHHGSCHNPPIVPNSSLKSSLNLPTAGPYTPVKTQHKPSSTFLNRQEIEKLPIFISISSKTILSQKTNTPLPYPENQECPTPRTCPPPTTEPNYKTYFGFWFPTDKSNPFFEP